MPPRSWTPADKANLVERVARGEPVDVIAHALDRTTQAIYAKAGNMGLTVGGRVPRKADTLRRRSTPFGRLFAD